MSKSAVNETTSPEEPQREKIRIDQEAWPFLFVIAIAAFILLAYYFYHFGTSGPPERTSLGVFGDYVGGVLNPLVATCALYALWRSVRIQKTELQETKESIGRQQIESAVFSLLDLIKRTVTDIRFHKYNIELTAPYQDDELVGEQALGFLKVRFINSYVRDSRESSIPESDPEQSEWLRHLAETNYAQMYERTEPYLGHLFRATYQTLKYIARNCPVDSSKGRDDRRFYVNLVRASISSNGFFLIGLNAAFGKWGTNFRSEPIRSLDFFEDMFVDMNVSDFPSEGPVISFVCEAYHVD